LLDEEKIVAMIGKGFTVQFVANFMSVHVDTLYANYSEALRKSRVFRDGCLERVQFLSAVKDRNVTMQIWLGKQWLGQTEKAVQQTTGVTFDTHIELKGHFECTPGARNESAPSATCPLSVLTGGLLKALGKAALIDHYEWESALRRGVTASKI